MHVEPPLPDSICAHAICNSGRASASSPCDIINVTTHLDNSTLQACTSHTHIAVACRDTPHPPPPPTPTHAYVSACIVRAQPWAACSHVSPLGASASACIHTRSITLDPCLPFWAPLPATAMQLQLQPHTQPRSHTCMYIRVCMRPQHSGPGSPAATAPPTLSPTAAPPAPAGAAPGASTSSAPPRPPVPPIAAAQGAVPA